MADEQPPDPADMLFRWSHFFQRCTEPIFLVNRRRQLLFVNAAWERLTGVRGTEARKHLCKRRRDAAVGSLEAVGHALAPPREALAGKQVQVRRLVQPASGPAAWWDVFYFPVLGPHGVLGLLGKIQTVPIGQTFFGQPLPEKLVALRQRRANDHRLAHLATATAEMRRVAEQVSLASRLHIPVLLVGEEGAGKEWLARTIHEESADRENTFIALDCQRLPTAPLARVLFDHGGVVQRGTGTVYFHEPAQLPRELQARLCEVFATPADPERPLPRILAGCSVDPREDVQAGRLLEEWHCVLSPLTIHVPPLRQRMADLPVLVHSLLERANRGNERVITGLTEEAWPILRSYAWPGNVRELYAVLATACGRCQGEVLTAGDLPWYLRPVSAPVERKLPLDKLLEQVERRLIEIALVMSKGNKSRAAEILEIWRPRLTRRIETLGIEQTPT